MSRARFREETTTASRLSVLTGGPHLSANRYVAVAAVGLAAGLRTGEGWSGPARASPSPFFLFCPFLNFRKQT